MDKQKLVAAIASRTADGMGTTYSYTMGQIRAILVDRTLTAETKVSEIEQVVAALDEAYDGASIFTEKS